LAAAQMRPVAHHNRRNTSTKASFDHSGTGLYCMGAPPVSPELHGSGTHAV